MHFIPYPCKRICHVPCVQELWYLVVLLGMPQLRTIRWAISFCSLQIHCVLDALPPCIQCILWARNACLSKEPPFIPKKSLVCVYVCMCASVHAWVCVNECVQWTAKLLSLQCLTQGRKGCWARAKVCSWPHLIPRWCPISRQAYRHTMLVTKRPCGINHTHTLPPPFQCLDTQLYTYFLTTKL